jgi:class 3 adenylate cyclase
VAQASPSEPSRRTLLVTVVFVDIVDYSARMVTQQAELKTRLNDMIARALEQVPAADRMILDTGDGAALCFLGDPEDALIAASNLRAAASGTLALRLGINLGPVKIVKDVNGRPNVIGDGINDAQRIMSFAQPNQIFVSRPYYEVLSRLSHEYSRLFSYVGVHRDKHVREHEVYAVAAGEATATEPAPAAAAPELERPLEPGRPADTGRAVEPVRAPEAARAPEPVRAGESVVDTEFVPAAPRASAPTPFDPAVLARLEAALADSIGPLARLIVRKAAGAAADVPQLCRAVAASVPDTKQAEFTRHLGDLAGHLGAAATPGAGPLERAAAAAAAPLQALPADVLARATERLAAYIGPVAKLMVKKAAERATSPRDLYERLAQHIDDPGSRERFIAANAPK